MYYTHTFAMDVVFDSDLSDVSEIDLDQSGPILFSFFLSILSRSNFDHHLRCGGWLNFEFS